MKRRLTWLLILLTLATGCNGSYSSGDRVLVAKDQYDIGLQKPERFQVVVFRCPAPPQRGGPLDNFIKRLLGLGGETLAIFFGHLFVTTDWQPPDDLDEQHVALAPEKTNPLDLWHKEYMYRDDANARALFTVGRFTARGGQLKKGSFKILRKPPEVMLAMSRIVYDNDYPAKDLEKANFPPRWHALQPGAWTAIQGHGFQADGKSENVEWLHYQHILRPLDWPTGPKTEPKAQLITDFIGYNSETSGPLGNQPVGYNWVGDLMLDFELTVERPEGELWLELVRAEDRFQACWELSSGKCTLYRLTGVKPPQELASAITTVNKAGTYHLRFANYDERLTVWVDGALPFRAGVVYPPSWYFDPNKGPKGAFVNTGPTKNDLTPASIGSKGAAVQLHHLRLWRNTYYTIGGEHEEHTVCDWDQQPEGPWEDFWSNPDKWGKLRELDFSTLYVQKGHYLCLGDNSPKSSDSRSWGTVPQRLMLGRALMVYYPFSRTGFIR
jgi:hypothetical protein